MTDLSVFVVVVLGGFLGGFFGGGGANLPRALV